MSSLTEAVEKAANQLESGIVEGEDKPTVEETPVEGEETLESDEEPLEEGVINDEDLDELSLKEAKTLYKALKDPKTASTVVSALAMQLGLLAGPKAVETPKEEVKAKKDILSIFKESLGKEFDFLAPKIAAAVDEVMQQQNEERQLEIQQTNNARIASETSTAMNAIAKRTNGESRKLEPKMVELSSKILPSPGMKVEEYIEVLYTLASSGKQSGIIKTQLNDKIRRNANDVTARIRSAGGNREETGIDPNKKYSLKESVALAVKMQEQKQNRK